MKLHQIKNAALFTIIIGALGLAFFKDTPLAAQSVGGRQEGLVAKVVPSGTILPFVGDNAPSGFALCDGRSIAIGEAPGLFAVIEQRWAPVGVSVPDGKFYLPNMAGMFLRGSDPAAGVKVGDRQKDTTARNGLALSGTTRFATADHTHAAGSLHARITYGVSHDFQMFVRKVNVPAWKSTYYGNQHPRGMGYEQDITEAAEVGGTSGKASKDGAVDLNDGDLETRPKNVSVNYIIKL